MRIDNYGSIAQISSQSDSSVASNTANTKNQSIAQKVATEDITTFSSDKSSNTDSAQSLTAAALIPTPSRAAKVDELKLAVNNAQYQLDFAKIAEALANAEI